MFTSQQGEDILIYNRYINQSTSDGVMVELGGVDGVTYSNTLVFEKYLGFKTILIEPQEYMFEMMVRNRPSAVCYRAAICDTSGEIEFIGKSPCAGIHSLMDDTHKQQWMQGANAETYMVPTKRLDAIFNENNIHHVDLLSIDVEGGEQNVLETIDFDKVEIYIICIELDEKNSEKDNACRDILTRNGFTKQHRLCINEFWVNESYSKKDRLYSHDKYFEFKGINNTKESNYGRHPFVERHIIDSINEYITTQQTSV